MEGIADVAYRALTAFGGDLTRDQAAALLPMWRYATDLTEQDRTMLLRRFPLTDRFAAEVARAMGVRR